VHECKPLAPGMRTLVTSLLDSVPLVMDVMVLLLWLFFIFGVIGVQAFGGKLKQRCFYEAGGVLRHSARLCVPMNQSARLYQGSP